MAAKKKATKATKRTRKAPKLDRAGHKLARAKKPAVLIFVAGQFYTPNTNLRDLIVHACPGEQHLRTA